jgi:hypothetical protein
MEVTTIIQQYHSKSPEEPPVAKPVDNVDLGEP